LTEVIHELFQSVGFEAMDKLETLIHATQTLSTKFEDFESNFREGANHGQFSEEEISFIHTQSEKLFSEANDIHKNSPIDKNQGAFVVDLNPIVQNDKFAFKNEISEGLVRFFDTNRWGFKDVEGETILPPQYEESGYFSNGLAPVKKNGYWKYINHHDEEMISLKNCKHAYPFYNGFALIQKDNTSFQIIDTTGATKVTLHERKLKWSSLQFHLFEKKHLSSWHPELVDFSGKTILHEPHVISEISPVSEGLVSYKTTRNPTYIYYDCFEKEKILYNTSYVEASLFHNGLAVVTDSKELTYIIDRLGHAKTPMRKQSIELISSGRYLVKFGFFPKKTAILNKEGKCIRGDCLNFNRN